MNPSLKKLVKIIFLFYFYIFISLTIDICDTDYAPVYQVWLVSVPPPHGSHSLNMHPSPVVATHQAITQ